jgi:hypothetical protein
MTLTDDAEALTDAVVVLLVALDVQEPWRRDALCREYENLDWHGPLPIAERVVCGRCQVRRDCLLAAFALGEQPPGVWGGLNQKERRAYVRAGLGADDVLAGREPPQRVRRTLTSPKPKPKRARCEGCDAVLPHGRTGRCSECVAN